MRTILILTIFACLLSLQSLNAQTSVVVTPGSGTLETAYNAASDGDTLILQNGEQYDIASYLTIDKKITIAAQDWVALPGLENMPVIYNQNASYRMFYMGDGCDLSLIGISINGNNGHHIFEPVYEFGPVIDMYIDRCRLYNSFNDIMTAPASNNVNQTFLRSFTLENSFLYDSQGHGIYTKDYEGGGEPWIFRNITYWNLGEQLTWIRAYPEGITQEIIFDHITGHNLSTNLADNKELFGNSDAEGESSLDITLKNSILSNQASTADGSLKFDNTSDRHDISLTHLLLHDVKPIVHLGGTINTSNIDETSNPQFNDTINHDFTVMNTALYNAADDGMILGALYWHPEYVDAGDTAAPQIVVSPVDLSFDTVFTNTVNTREIQIANYGTDTLVIDTIILNSDAFVVSGEVSAIPAKQSKTLEVTLNVSEQGFYNNDLYIVNNTENDTVTVSLEAQAIHPPVMTVSPLAVDEILTLQNQVNKPITIQNEGEGGALNYSVSLEDFDPAEEGWISLDKSSGSVLAGESDEVAATLNANGMSLGIYTANIVITDTDSVNDPEVIPVTLEITDNVPPQIVNPVQYITDYITMEETRVDLHTVFDDTEDDVLRFEHAVQHDTIVGLKRSGHLLTLEYNNPGHTEVYIEAIDDVGSRAVDTFTVEILNNQIPVLGKELPDTTLNMNGSGFYILRLNDVFYDEDDDELFYHITSSDTAIAQVSAYDSIDTEIIIVLMEEGFSAIDVVAGDGKSKQKARDKFILTVEDIPLSLAEHGNDENGISIFPNPADHWVNVTLPGTGHAELNLYNVQGERVRNATTGEHVTKLDIGDLDKGLYMLKVNQNGNNQVVKLMVE